MDKAIYRIIWANLNDDEEILSMLGLTKNTDKKIVRDRILPAIPFKYIEKNQYDKTELPKIVFGNVAAHENGQIPFLTDIEIEIHIWSKDETYTQNRELLNRIRAIIEEETFQIDPDHDNISYWSGFKWNGQAKIPLYVSDLYIMFDSYSLTVAPKSNKKLTN